MAVKWLIAVSCLATALLAFAGLRTLPPEGMPATVRPYSYELLREGARNLLTKGAFLLRPLAVASENRTLAVEQFFLLEQRFNPRDTSSRGSRVGLQQPAEFLDELASVGREELRELVEDTLEDQVRAILAEQGLAFSMPLSGITFPFPPVRFTLQTPPSLLITSPRDRIRLRAAWLLSSNLRPEEMAAIEEQTASGSVSALVEPLGGLAVYPSIVRRGDALRATLTSVAHEWIHQYLYFYPLGRNYGASYEMKTLNEMVATIAGKEIGEAAYQRFYARGAHPPPADNPSATRLAAGLNRDLAKIRRTVDGYLAQGEIAKAEVYMDEQRQLLASRGFRIRKLNQAYFAFHGAYADSPAAVSPMEGHLKDLRKKTGSLAGFLRLIGQVGSPSDLANLVAR
ncbi:MAG: hypothetical protein HYX92_02305 [Chloroflexi bacterium]|nr:hypothetical protein [Chloroflexota bacterium]